MSDELFDKLDAWGRSKLEDSRLRLDEKTPVKFLSSVRAERAARAWVKNGVAALIIVAFALLTIFAVRNSHDRPDESAPTPRAVEERPLRAIDR